MPTAVLIPATAEGAAAAGGALARFRSEFASAPDPAQWDVSVGSGMVLSPAQTAQGTVLLATMGTTPNAVTTLTSTQVFTAPMKLIASVQLSQKIVNNQVYLEVVGCDRNGVVDETHATAWRFSGDDNTTATNASVESSNGLLARVRVANQTVSTYVGAIGGTAPSVTFEIEHLADEVWFHVRPTDSTSGRANSYSRSSTLPDAPFYKVRIRLVNGAVAPASSTSVWVGHVSADAHTETPVEVVNSRGSAATGQALPVQVLGTPTTNVATGQAISQSASATAGTAPSVLRVDALLAAAQTVKASAGRLYWATIYNPTAAMAAVHFYNATAPTVGTTTPIFTVPVAAGGTVHIDVGGMPLLAFSTACTVAATTTATTAGAVAPASALSVSVGYV